MAKVLIAIAFLTTLAQLQCGLGNGRYGVRRQTMSRVGTLPRLLLRSMSRTNTPTKSADLFEPSVLPSRQSDVVNAMENPLMLGRMNDVFGADIDAFRKRANEMQSEIKKLMLRDPSKLDWPTPESGTAQPLPRKNSFPSSNTLPDSSSGISKGVGGFKPSTLRVPDSIPPAEATQPPSRKDSFPFRGAFGGSFGFNFDPPPKTPESSNPPATPSSHSSNDRFRVQEPPSTSTMFTTPILPPPASCSAGKQKPSINQYHTKPSISKSPSIKGDGNDTSKATRRKSGDIGSSLPRSNSGSLKNQRVGGKTAVSEQLPNNGGTIEILISGNQIDDERMSQMIKEARNAITAVFYAPLYDTTEKGYLVYEERPPMRVF